MLDMDIIKLCEQCEAHAAIYLLEDTEHVCSICAAKGTIFAPPAGAIRNRQQAADEQLAKHLAVMV